MIKKVFVLSLLIVLSMTMVSAENDMTKEEIAYAFGIKNIYHPIDKQNVPIYQITREELISYLNNLVTQKLTFPTDVAGAQQLLRDLDLEVEGYTHDFGSKSFDKDDLLEDSGPAPTAGLKTKSAAMRESGNFYIGRERKAGVSVSGAAVHEPLGLGSAELNVMALLIFVMGFALGFFFRTH